jgi:hypothetical protein
MTAKDGIARSQPSVRINKYANELNHREVQTSHSHISVKEGKTDFRLLNQRLKCFQYNQQLTTVYARSNL